MRHFNSVIIIVINNVFVTVVVVVFVIVSVTVIIIIIAAFVVIISVSLLYLISGQMFVQLRVVREAGLPERNVCCTSEEYFSNFDLSCFCSHLSLFPFSCF